MVNPLNFLFVYKTAVLFYYCLFILYFWFCIVFSHYFFRIRGRVDGYGWRSWYILFSVYFYLFIGWVRVAELVYFVWCIFFFIFYFDGGWKGCFGWFFFYCNFVKASWGWDTFLYLIPLNPLEHVYHWNNRCLKLYQICL